MSNFSLRRETHLRNGSSSMQNQPKCPRLVPSGSSRWTSRSTSSLLPRLQPPPPLISIILLIMAPEVPRKQEKDYSTEVSSLIPEVTKLADVSLNETLAISVEVATLSPSSRSS